MRMGELVGKEIVNIYNGARLGVVGDSDMAINIDSGIIQSIILPKKNTLVSLWFDKQHLVIPWEAVRKIGSEVIVVELDQTSPGGRRYSM